MSLVVQNIFLKKDLNIKKYRIVSIILFVCGICMVSFGVLQTETLIVKMLTILKPSGYVRKLHHMKKGLPFSYELYLWNVTNPDQIVAGTEPPKMQEIGPYVFS